MLKKFVFVLGCVLVSYGAASASTVAVRDSVGVKVQNGKTYITHKVEPKETLYALSRKYGVPVAKITEVNKNIEKSLIVGQLVLIPILSKTTAATVAKTAQAPANKPSDAPASTPAANRTYEIDDKGNKKHEVQPRQTLFSISRLHGVTVDDLKKWNKLPDNTVSVGQSLIVGVGAKAPAQAAAKSKIYVPEKDDAVSATKETTAATTTMATTNPVTTASTPITATVKTNPEPAKTETSEEKSAGKTTEYVSRVNESGMAEQIDQKADANKFLALHKTAPVGTIMAVKNPQNDQTVYVRVIGKLPSTGDNDKVVVKLSKKACQQIGAVDKRFRVEVSYMP